jgi:plasmid stabilization system protein ParE
MTIVIAPKAQEDLRVAYAYVYRDNPKAADQLLMRITEMIGSLAAGLIKGKEVRLNNGQVVNTWPIPPYRIYYRIQRQEFQVIRVYHQARPPIER